MKTAKMFEELSKDPTKEFKRLDDGLIMSAGTDEVLLWDSGYRYLRLQDEWEEVRKPVDFMTAINGIKGKIGAEYDGVKIPADYIDQMFFKLGELYTDIFIRNLILHGNWYIEE